MGVTNFLVRASKFSLALAPPGSTTSPAIPAWGGRRWVPASPGSRCQAQPSSAMKFLLKRPSNGRIEMITHTVIFRLNRPATTGQRKQFLEALEDFGRAAPHATGPALVHADLQMRPEGRSVSEFLMEVRFADPDAFKNYLNDPKHQRLVTDVLVPQCESWLSVQAETN
ncbi:Dabb family protein [Arthrobacter sp. CAU 1506]|uniref:Dabb family protein n=1 Tax=Arthrobacter sp. CAU 1506 TaxID=2560052 RepID=UPI0010AC819A|nr:Dabb family protein [Arthrobacter sp. CAU 1506]TJY66128.1 Dabb family protein [Arthrobacter sp. CAU 1506]